MDRLYIVIRSDLSPGARCAQACHTLRAFVDAHPGIDREWFTASNNLVVLEAPHEAYLVALASLATQRGVAVATFREPDYSDALTGVALGPSEIARRLVSSLPLALKFRAA